MINFNLFTAINNIVPSKYKRFLRLLLTLLFIKCLQGYFFVVTYFFFK